MNENEPIPSKYRPNTLDEFIGQDHLIGEGKPLTNFINNKKIPSMVFWGPPGTGKTTLAEIITKSIDAHFYKLSAVLSGKEDLKKIIISATKDINENGMFKKPTVLFLDEIHRWSKSQQDSLLPYVERGIITLIGATTENPSFSIIPALISRVRVFTFKRHTVEDIKKYLKIIISKLEKDKIVVNINDENLALIADLADGDLRSSGNILETAINLASGKEITNELIKQSIEKFLQYEKTGEDHYNIISAVHKSLRDSDPTAGVYWIVRMLEAGDDPLYIARRLLRFASEDIGNSDPQAVILAHTIFESCQKLGRPECDIFLVQLAEYLARAPKNNKAYTALQMAQTDVREKGGLLVPLVIRNGVSKLMKELGYGKDYKYAHNYKDAKVDNQHMPDELIDRDYFGDKDVV